MKNKILSILCIFILISCLLVSSVFAFDVTDRNDVLHSLPDLPKGEPVTYVYCLNDGNYDVLLVSYVEGSYFKLTGKGSVYHVRCFNSNNEEINYTILSKFQNRTSWERNDTVSVEYLTISNLDNGDCAGTLYAEDGTLFFQQPPVTETATLAPILEKVEMVEPMTKEILTLVPIMIILIASYLGLRKGLTFIKTLRKM